MNKRDAMQPKDSTSYTIRPEKSISKGREYSRFIDIIGDRRPDPATACARRLDWDRVDAGLDARARAVVRATAAGELGKSLAQGLGVSAAAIVHIKRRAAAAVLEAWSCSGLEEALIPEPRWRRRLANA